MGRTKAAGFSCKNGMWGFDTKVKVNGEYLHLKRTGFLTLKEAKESLEIAKNELIESKTNYKKEATINSLLSEYEAMRKMVVDQSTLECDISTFNVYFYPYFKNKSLKDVFKESVIYDWYSKLVSSPKYSNNKKSKVITRMKDVLKFAYQHKYISADTYQDCDVVLYQVKYTKAPEVERVVWTDDEEKAFLSVIKANKRDDLMFRLFLSISPRLGEFLALQPNCFDFEKNKVNIYQQVKNIRGKGYTLTDKLKTHESYRSIAISSSLAQEIKQYITDFGIKDDQYVWHSFRKSTPMSRNTIRRLFDHYCELAKVRRMNLHALRHNQAFRLARVCHTGEEIEIAARRLGHSPSMFLNTYANHANDKKECELLERMSLF